MTLNAVIALIFRLFPDFDRFSGRFTVIEDRSIVSVKYCLPVHFWPRLWRTLQRGSLRSVAEHLVETLAVIGLPVTSCSAECSFSCLRRLKNYTRSTMDQERISSLAICTIQSETANKVINNDTELLINKFARKNGRNTHFFWSVWWLCTYSYSVSHTVSAV